MFDVNLYIRENRNERNFAKHIVCKDGFHMSVQASWDHCCIPREDDAPYYSHVEVGYTSQVEQRLLPYLDGSGTATIYSIYPHVPIEIVENIIMDHGGLKDA